MSLYQARPPSPSLAADTGKAQPGPPAAQASRSPGRPKRQRTTSPEPAYTACAGACRAGTD
eukprot:5155434-Alexandrium_andersonii.AAC.1